LVCRWQATSRKGAEDINKFIKQVKKKKNSVVNLIYFINGIDCELTKYVVGAKANPPKNPRRPLKKGNVIPTNIVNAAMKSQFHNINVYSA
jgi:hypothetical protein